MSQKQKTHAYITCADPLLNTIVADEVAAIRQQGGILDDSNIARLPGGVHLLSAIPACRETLYYMIGAYHTLFGIDVIHYRPHTNCKFCGLHVQKKLGNGTMSDLSYHLKSARKLLHGAMEHFSALPEDSRPRIDTRIILTTDQKIVSIEEADHLVLQVPEHIPHGCACLTPPVDGLLAANHTIHQTGHGPIMTS